MIKENKFHEKWPTLFGEFYNPNHPEIKDDLILFFKDYMKKNSAKKDLGENFKLFESEYDLHNQGNPAFKKLLTEFIMQSFLAMSNEANKKQIEKFDDKQKFTVSIKDSWFIYYERDGFVLPHLHGNCSWCCVYYVQLGDDAKVTNGSTYFQKPIPTRITTDFGSEYNQYLSTTFEPEEGKLIIWPHYLMHGSYPYSGKKNRIIVSANALVTLNKNKENQENI